MARDDHKDVPATGALQRRDFLRKAAVGTAGVGVLAACGEGASAGAATAEGAVQGPQVNWRLATSFPPSLDILHGAAVRIAERVSALTGGRFQIRVYPAGEIVPGLQVMDAVEAGTVHAGLTPSYYYIGKSAALAFDTAVPFGFNTRQHSAWLYHGGGNELIREVYSDFNIVQFPGANTGAQFGGWFRRPVDTLADLRGLRFRIPGYGGEVMARLGVSVQNLSGADIYPALERGAIDATEWVGPYDDEKLGFQQIAPYYYVPGWWEPSASSSILVGTNAWNALPESYKHVIETVTKEGIMDSVARYDAANPAALARLVAQGTQIRTFSPEIMEAAWRESNAFLEETASGDPAFRKIHTAWKAFREESFRYFGGNELAYQQFAFSKFTGPAAQ